MGYLMPRTVRASFLYVVVWLAGHALVTAAAVAQSESPAAPGIEDEARAALARMSETLRAKQFSFHAQTFRSYVGRNGELLHIAHAMTVVFRRPDRLAVDITGDEGSVQMTYDGKAVTLYGVEQKQYATIPVTGSIDNALDAVQERTGTDFPLADLLSDDPEGSFLAGVTSGYKVGTSTIEDAACRHFFFVQAPDVEFELWLEDNERATPRRFVVTYRTLPGRPTMIAELSDWDLSAEVDDSTFEFNPPAGVTEVELTSKAAGSSSSAPR